MLKTPLSIPVHSFRIFQSRFLPLKSIELRISGHDGIEPFRLPEDLALLQVINSPPGLGHPGTINPNASSLAVARSCPIRSLIH